MRLKPKSGACVKPDRFYWTVFFNIKKYINTRAAMLPRLVRILLAVWVERTFQSFETFGCCWIFSVTDFALNFIHNPSPAIRKPVMLITVMVIAMGADLMAYSFAHFSGPGLFLLPAIAVVGIFTGMTYAFVAAGISVLFVAADTTDHSAIFHSPWNSLIRLCLFSTAAPIIAVVVGLQYRRVEEVTSGRVNQALRARAKDLAELAAALKLSNEELDQFTYVASHDLKAPLRGIHNLSHWLEEDLGDRMTSEAREQLRLLRGRVQRMESLINGLLEYAHVGRAEGKLEQVNVSTLLGEIVDWISPPPDVEIQVVDGMPVFNADKLRLQQVLTNLIENAVKHRGQPGGHISVQCDAAGRFYRFSVADDGQGIERQYQQRIFGIFQTLMPRDRLEGTGIGLALVKKIVEGKGGEITVESVPGHGATFRFTWPMAEGKNQ
jgi:signal transduction histidine kinase